MVLIIYYYCGVILVQRQGQDFCLSCAAVGVGLLGMFFVLVLVLVLGERFRVCCVGLYYYGWGFHGI